MFENMWSVIREGGVREEQYRGTVRKMHSDIRPTYMSTLL